MRYAEDAYPERAALGAILINPESTIEDALDILGEDPQCFGEEMHQFIYSAYIDLYRDGDPIDVVAVLDRLSEQGVLKRYTGISSYVGALPDVVPTSHHFTYYAAAVRRDFIKREIISALTKTGGALERKQMTEEEAMSAIEQKMFTLGQRREGNRPVPISEIIPGVLSSIRTMHDKGTLQLGPLTGLSRLDALMNGLKPGTLNVLAARPSVGKTAVAINIALSAAKQGYPVLFFTLEMDRIAIGQRMVTLISRTSLKTLTGNFIPEVQAEKLKAAALELDKCPIEIVDAGQLDIIRLRARARRFAGIVFPRTPVVIIDYLQLSARSSASEKQRNELIGDFTRECKQLAGELHCPFLLLSQLNRMADDADNPFRVMHCLKDSGNIEEDSDTVTILLKDTPEYAQKNAASLGVPKENTIIGGLVKNKYGPTGSFPMYFEKETQFVQDLSDFRGHPDTAGQYEDDEDSLI